MSDKTCLLITLVYDHHLMKCALKATLPNDIRVSEWQEHRSFFYDLLPLHVRECGSIVDVEEIFEVVVIP